MDESDIDLVVAGTRKAVTMIEACSKNVSEGYAGSSCFCT
jgi:polyribonucleotide nucleotidyltransferase